MLKLLNFISMAIKFATVVTGAVAANPDTAAMIHLDVGTLGKVVAGLGTAASFVKFGQIKVQPVTSSQLNK